MAGLVARGITAAVSLFFAVALLTSRGRARAKLAVLRASDVRFRGTFGQAAIGIAHEDISARKAAEVALRDANTLLEARVAARTAELAASEERLRQAQRMETVGQLTAGVAHDFNNMLQVILGILEMLREQPGLDAEGRECVEVAEDAAERSAALVHRLLAFSRKQVVDPVLLRPGDVIADIGALLTRTLGGRIRLKVSAEDAVWPVRADGAQLDNCLFNLALNARDAMPGGGMLWLRAGNAGTEAAQAAGLPSGEYVRFTVEDEGAGMAPETLAHALEPFFTTKPVGQGTGLGLFMVQGFARQSGGDMRIESAPGRGTTVSLWLPRAAEAAKIAGSPVAEERVSHGRGRVLVVDDEAALGRTLSLFLSKAGFVPVAVESGEAALDALRAGEAFDLLVTDQSMPRLTGCELIEEAARLCPALPTLLVTGYDTVSGLDRIEGRVTVLRKPFERAAFVRQVQALIGATVLDAMRDAAPAAPNVVQLRAGPG